MSICLYSKEEFKDVMREDIYFYEDLESVLEKKVLFVGIEGDVTKEEEFAYDVIESVLEDKIPVKGFCSKIGEEEYSVFELDKEEVSCLEDVPCLESIIGKKFVIVECCIPGMVDYILTFKE